MISLPSSRAISAAREQYQPNHGVGEDYVLLLAALIARLEGKEITLTLKRWSKRRSSLAEPVLLGGLIAMFAEHLGYDVPRSCTTN